MIKNRLSKIIASAGIASRRAAERLIFDGHIKVNGAIITLPQTLVDPDEDYIEYQSRRIRPLSTFIYLKLNKPRGFVCSHKKFGDEKLVYELLDQEKERLFCIGRLDKDTEGLILLTNDGHFANRVIHPSSDIEKEYVATVDQPITALHLKKIASGTIVEECFVKPKTIKLLNPQTLQVIVTEGKKREVRKFIESALLKVLSLKRTRIGRLTLDNLPLGQYEALTAQEMENIFLLP